MKKKLNYVFMMFIFVFFLTEKSSLYGQNETAISPPNRTAKMAYQLAFKAYKKNLYFTSASYMKLFLMQDGEVSVGAAKLLDAILVNTNIFPFLDIPFSVLAGVNYSKNISFVIAKKYFFKRDYPNAIVYLRKIGPRSKYFLSAQHHLAGLYQMIGEKEQSDHFISECLKHASKRRKTKQDIIEEKAEYIFDSCQSMRARHWYKFGSNDNAEAAFKKVPLNSYVFPQTLFESSWSYYLKNDFQRAIGKNITFQSPILEDYFIPESELVKTLSYLELCLYEDAIGVMRFFDKETKSKVNDFMKEFNLRSGADYPFAKLFTDKSQRLKLGDNFFNRQLNVIWTRPGFQTIKYYLQRINNEKELIARVGTPYDRKAFALAYRDFLEFFNDFVKIKFVKMAKSIIKINNIFSEIELDVYSSIKYQLYDEKAKVQKKVDEPEKFYVKNIKRDTRQYYWNFHGEFWADELGSYIPYLDSRCSDKNIYMRAIKNFEK